MIWRMSTVETVPAETARETIPTTIQATTRTTARTTTRITTQTTVRTTTRTIARTEAIIVHPTHQANTNWICEGQAYAWSFFRGKLLMWRLNVRFFCKAYNKIKNVQGKRHGAAVYQCGRYTEIPGEKGRCLCGFEKKRGI